MLLKLPARWKSSQLRAYTEVIPIKITPLLYQKNHQEDQTILKNYDSLNRYLFKDRKKSRRKMQKVEQEIKIHEGIHRNIKPFSNRTPKRSKRRRIY